MAVATGRLPLLGQVLNNPHATVAYEASVFRRMCEAPPLLAIEHSFGQDSDVFAYMPPPPPPPDVAVVSMAGFWQNWRYVDLPPRALRALFAPPPDLIARLEREYGPLADCAAVHVRRGDYLENENARGIDEAYFEAALRRFQGAAGPLPSCLLVASDDIAWAMKQPCFVSRSARFVTQEDEVATFYLLAAAARGLICPNSTFCWWAAVLGRDDDGVTKRFVALPKPWANDVATAPDSYYFPGVVTIDRRDWVHAGAGA